MSDQNDIDNLFRKAFKDFEASPDPALWDKISSKLDETSPQPEKEKDGITFLPWFYRIAGIAAAILLLIALGNQFFSDDSSGINPENQTTATSKEDPDSSNASTQNQQTSKTQVTKAEKDADVDLKGIHNSQNATLKNQENTIATQTTTDELNSDNQNSNTNTNLNIKNGNALRNRVANQENGIKSNNFSQQNTLHKNKSNNSSIAETNLKLSQENTIADTNSKSTQSNSSQNSIGDKSQTSSTVTDEFKNSVAKNKTTDSQQTNDAKYSHTVADTNNSNTSSTKKGVQSSVAAEVQSPFATDEKNTAVAQNDTKETSQNTSEKAVASTEDKKDEIQKSLLDVINELHELEKETDIADAAETRKWTISPNASPVYYNTLVDGSPIASTFADNAKTGDVNLSFGVNVGYDVSNRLTIRSGIHKVDYSYNTQDVAIVPSVSTGPLQANGGFPTNGTISNDINTITFSQNASTYSLRDKQVTVNGEFEQALLDTSIRQAQIEGNLNQRMSYIEVPIELKYAVIDKKIGINLIGGVSTLLLTENSIVLDAPSLTAELGEANNLNDVSFSTNIGIGVDYQISKQLEFNLEPMLKYQINTFSGNTGNFRPYSVGVYTGVSFRF